MLSVMEWSLQEQSNNVMHSSNDDHGCRSAHVAASLIAMATSGRPQLTTRMREIDRELGEVVRAARGARDLSQSKLGELLVPHMGWSGESPAGQARAISQLELGQKSWTVGTLDAFATVLGTTVVDMLRATGDHRLSRAADGTATPDLDRALSDDITIRTVDKPLIAALVKLLRGRAREVMPTPPRTPRVTIEQALKDAGLVADDILSVTQDIERRLSLRRRQEKPKGRRSKRDRGPAAENGEGPRPQPPPQSP